MRAIQLLSRNKLLLMICSVLLIVLFGPLYLNRGDLPAGEPQNKCDAHEKFPPGSLEDPRNIERPNESIKIIRLTNAGEFVKRCELTNALYELNWDRSRPHNSFGVRVRSDAKSLPKLVLLYIHGWKHNSNDDDTDRKNFEALVKHLKVKEKDRKHIVGIYVSWNADAGLWGPLENISFWAKKNNADRIAQSSIVTQIFSAVGSIVRADPTQKDQFIAIGHSFGARLLFAATTQPIVSAIEQAHPGYPGGTYKIIKGFADAVILLNPAFEASRYSAISRVIRYEEKFSIAQPPLIITISSTGDAATKTAFPIGQWFGLARTARELHTLGNYKPFRTHVLDRTGAKGCVSEPNISETYAAAGLCLKRTKPEETDKLDVANTSQLHPFNPFIVAETTPAIIKDHNDIWNEQFRNWLVSLIESLQSTK